MQNVLPKFPPIANTYVLRKGRRQWKAMVGYLNTSVLIEVSSPSVHSMRDKDFQEWADEILDNMAESKWQIMQIIYRVGLQPIKHEVYKISDPNKSE